MKGTSTICGNPGCEVEFEKKSALHTYCSMRCRKAARGPHWRTIRKEALKRDGFKCQACGAHNCRLEAHHVVPVCVGGANELDNLTVLCVPCHKQAHRTWDEYFAIVRRK
jgi:5-methylcytosine-specific restriction endonuclease McrA